MLAHHLLNDVTAPTVQTDSDHLVPLLTLRGKASWEFGGDSDCLIWVDAMARSIPKRCDDNDITIRTQEQVT